MKPPRRLVSVKPAFDVVGYLTGLLSHENASIRLAGVYGLSMHSFLPAVRLALTGREQSDPHIDVRLAAKRVLNGNI